MDFEKKIGFICRTEYEWNTCQKVLLKKGFRWENTYFLNYPNWNKVEYSDPFILFINYYKPKNLGYGLYSVFNALIHPYGWPMQDHYYKHVPDMTYEANVLLRKYKLEKINLT